MLRNSQVASSRLEIAEITCFIVLFLFGNLSLASLLSSVATQWWGGMGSRPPKLLMIGPYVPYDDWGYLIHTFYTIVYIILAYK